MTKSITQSQNFIFRLTLLVTLIVTSLSCNENSKKNPDKFIGQWLQIGQFNREVDRARITIEKFGDNFSIKSNTRGGVATATYDKENDKLIVPGILGNASEAIYNYETKSILIWGFECKKASE